MKRFIRLFAGWAVSFLPAASFLPAVFFLPAASFLPACVHDERDAIPYGAAGQAVFGFFEDSEDAA